METADILTIIGSIGGVQGFIELVKWWHGRKVRDRQEIATVEAAEEENDRAQIDWLEKRLANRDEKVDALYCELRKTQADLLAQIHANHELALQLKEAEIKKCHKHGCKDRQPPSDY